MSPSFADVLTLRVVQVLETARKAGHLPLGTFDRALGAIEGAEQL